MRAYQAQFAEHLHTDQKQQPTTEATEADQQTAVTTQERQRRTYYAYADDDQAVAAIRQKYALSTDSDAVRLALRLVAGGAIKITTAAPVARRIVLKLKMGPPPT